MVGETAIVTPNGRRTATIKAVTFCELYMLTKAAFIEAGRNSAKFSSAIRLAAHKRDIGREVTKKLRRSKHKMLAFVAFCEALSSWREKKKKKQGSVGLLNPQSLRTKNPLLISRMPSISRLGNTSSGRAGACAAFSKLSSVGGLVSVGAPSRPAGPTFGFFARSEMSRRVRPWG